VLSTRRRPGFGSASFRNRGVDLGKAPPRSSSRTIVSNWLCSLARCGRNFDPGHKENQVIFPSIINFSSTGRTIKDCDKASFLPQTLCITAKRRTPCNAPCTSAGGKRRAKVGFARFPKGTPNPTSIYVYVCVSPQPVSHSSSLSRPSGKSYPEPYLRISAIESITPERNRICTGPAHAPATNTANFRALRCL